MRQILQNLKTGQTQVSEVPCPQIKQGHLLIKSQASLISAGTERMLIDFGKANYLQKAKSQPEKVKQVLDKIRTDGLVPTVHAVRSKLDQPLPLGYCNAGVVQEIEEKEHRVADFKVGDRVISNGPHAEMVCVPKNLCARIPDGIENEEAAFTVIAAVGLQGVRLAQPTLSELFVVTGLGLVGLLTVQILRTNGCRVLGIDLDPAKLELARQFGAETVDLSRLEDPLSIASTFSDREGVDGVIITAATKSSEPVHQAAQMCRKRGRIVLVGVTGLELNRQDFYEKELSFQVSCSYGPGRYDSNYEQKGQDYPLPYVRWTEQRNFEAVLQLMTEGKLDVKPLISHRFQIEEAGRAYDLIAENTEPYLGIVLTYGEVSKTQKAVSRTIKLKEPVESAAKKSKYNIPMVGLIGAGNYTRQVLLPALRKTGARLKTIASSGGVSGTHLGRKFGFEQSTTDSESVFLDSEINTVFITTRHNTHAKFVAEAIKAKQNIFVEKPLCLSGEQLNQLIYLFNQSIDDSTDQLIIMVGFNRRFAPHIVRIKKMLDTVREPKSFIMTVNAGFIPGDHWTQDPEIGGGRIIGEACHFIDLLRFLVGYKIVTADLVKMRTDLRDTVSISMTFEDGSIGSVHYFANGNKSFPKERLEVFCAGRILQLDNFRSLTGYGWTDFKKMKLLKQDKGHGAGVTAFINAVQNGGLNPIPFSEIVEVTKVSLELAEAAR